VEEVLEQQRAFVADASHQLRNPLTAVRLRVESLDVFVEPGGQPVLDAALNEIRRLSSILDALLSLAGAQARERHPAPVDLAALTAERVDAWAPAARQRGITLVYGDRRPAIAWCPPDIVDQVLDVLLDNAVGLSPPGGTVEVRTVSARARVEVHVADHGPGMTPEDKARACDRFWRGRAADEREGTGLGLAIAATLLNAAGGSLAFHDVHPRGLDAEVRLPAWTGDQDRTPCPWDAGIGEFVREAARRVANPRQHSDVLK
jgi:signal transduction histidine kinase